MKQRPIIFNTEMVRAILDGRKTQTRRPMNPQPKPDTETSKGGNWFPCAAFQSMVHVEDFKDPLWRGMASDACPICSVGDQLYVRETWYQKGCYCMPMWDGADAEDAFWSGTNQAKYFASDRIEKVSHKFGEYFWRKRPSIHMPRWAARIILEVTDIRVERLNDISEQDAIKEGCNAIEGCKWHTFEEADRGIPMHDHTAKDAFWAKWESIYGYQSWQSNPWVWVIDFKVISTTGGEA
ncbi:hypothetical protein [Shewanella xiamenensis]|uniref:hypothetical protein n=1 Tax=Shewanella xiamenensis TaxID=332186 RepID=UPI00217EA1F4|nr:hypothetical protein [Shewanella xiamenensis]MCT8874164.1 hypothetical protein [Shewanella xiamenensis]UWH42835.1 hypothetical protein KXJ80_06130 [Shewanella xiamenensis]